MLRAVARHPASPDLASVRDELAEHGHVLVVDVVHPVLAENAELLLLLLLPGLLFLLLALSNSSHPAVSPPAARPRRLPLPRTSRPGRRFVPASPSWRWPTS